MTTSVGQCKAIEEISNICIYTTLLLNFVLRRVYNYYLITDNYNLSFTDRLD